MVQDLRLSRGHEEFHPNEILKILQTKCIYARNNFYCTLKLAAWSPCISARVYVHFDHTVMRTRCGGAGVKWHRRYTHILCLRASCHLPQCCRLRRQSDSTERSLALVKRLTVIPVSTCCSFFLKLRYIQREKKYQVYSNETRVI